MWQNDRIPIAIGCPSQETLPLRTREILIISHENIGIWISRAKARSELRNRGVIHYQERFLSQPSSLHFHGGHDLLQGLASTNLVSQKAMPLLKHSPNRIQLVWHPAELVGKTRHREMRTIIVTLHMDVERRVVGILDLLSTIRIRINERMKSRLNLLGVHPCFRSGRSIDHESGSSASSLHASPHHRLA